jgi:hypothetical protein
MRTPAGASEDDKDPGFRNAKPSCLTRSREHFAVPADEAERAETVVDTLSNTS